MIIDHWYYLSQIFQTYKLSKQYLISGIAKPNWLKVLNEWNDRIDASLFGDLPCLKYDPIITPYDLSCISEDIEYLIIGNGCLNKVYGDILEVIDFSRLMNVRVIDVYKNSLQNVRNVDISSMIVIDWWLIWSS